MSRARIELPQEKIAEFCRRHRIKRLALFGSVLRDDFTDESDVDVLVEFEEGTQMGFRYFGIQRELAEMLGREVEMLTPASLSPYFREEVLRELEVLYDAPRRHGVDATHA
jgi:uncharacterized protein